MREVDMIESSIGYIRQGRLRLLFEKSLWKKFGCGFVYSTFLGTKNKARIEYTIFIQQSTASLAPWHLLKSIPAVFLFIDKSDSSLLFYRSVGDN